MASKKAHGPFSARTVNVPKQYARADVVPDSLDREARTFDVVWTTGARVLRGWYDRFWEELSLDPAHVKMGRFEAGAPVLADHVARAAETYGTTENARLEAGRGVAKVRFLSAGKDPEADKLFERVAEKIVRGISVGYVIHKLVKIEETREGFPVYRAESWEPHELSLTPIPADAGAHVRSAEQETYPCEIITRGDAPQKEQNGMTPEEIKAAEEAKRRAEQEAEASRQAAVEAARTAAIEAERARVAEVQRIARQAQAPAQIVDSWVEDGRSTDEVRKLALDLVAERSQQSGPRQGPSGAVETGETAEQKRTRGMVAALISKAGGTRAVEDARKHPQHGALFANVDTDGGEFRGFSLLEMARRHLEDHGVKTRGLDRMAVAGLALQRRSVYQGKDTFPVLFEEALHKLLLAAYTTVPDTWRRICDIDTVPDFRTSNRYRNGSFGTLDVVGENGEFTTKVIPDGEKRTISTETRGNIITLTRQTVVNDDMGAMADLARRFGRAAGLTLEVTLYQLLAQNGGLGPIMGDGNTFFHATHGNIGTPAALSVAGLESDRVTMGQQKDPSNNEYLELRPAILVVPLGLGGQARVINQAQFDVDAVAPGATNKFQQPNKVVGLFRDIVDTARVSGTRRYLIAEPGTAAAFKAVFLEGTGETPVMEMEEGFDVDGVRWKVRMDGKMVAFDWRAAVTNAGA